jgi:hypothetical protein
MNGEIAGVLRAADAGNKVGEVNCRVESEEDSVSMFSFHLVCLVCGT